MQFLYLDDRDARLEPGGQLREHLPKQLLVLQDFPHLHDPHDRSLQNRAGKTSKETVKLGLDMRLTWT